MYNMYEYVTIKIILFVECVYKNVYRESYRVETRKLFFIALSELGIPKRIYLACRTVSTIGQPEMVTMHTLLGLDSVSLGGLFFNPFDQIEPVSNC